MSIVSYWRSVSCAMTQLTKRRTIQISMNSRLAGRIENQAIVVRRYCCVKSEYSVEIVDCRDAKYGLTV